MVAPEVRITEEARVMQEAGREFNPYVGPRPFERAEQRLFFGRDWEAAEMAALMITHPAVLLYAESGAGKSSLLNARVLPALEAAEGCELLPVARMRGDIPPEVQVGQIKNLYVFNTLVSWSETTGLTPAQCAELSLADFLRQLPHQSDHEGYPALRIAVFDQFEELFTFYPERWLEREGFFMQVNQALAEDSLLRVLLVIREDYLAQLDPYAPALPEQLRSRFRLERLRREAALAAVVGPLRGTGRSFAPGVAEELVAELLKIRVEDRSGAMIETPGEFVEPVQLQVVCQSLWAELPPEVTEISQSHRLAFGNVDQALTRFYEKAIKQTSQQTGFKERRLRAWFDRRLITSAGTRSLVYREAKTTGGAPNAAVDILEGHHLIRGEQRAGGRWYELTHDRFIDPIQKSNIDWRTRRLRTQIMWAVSVLVVMVLAALALVFIAGQDSSVAVQAAEVRITQLAATAAANGTRARENQIILATERAKATRTPPPVPSATSIIPTLVATLQPDVAASSGGTIAYPAFDGETYNLYFGDVASGANQLYRQEASQPAFSPDGSRIVFVSWGGGSRGLVTASRSGGNEILIDPAPESKLPTWSPDGRTILFFTRRSADRASQLFRTQADVAFTGGKAQQFLTEGEYPTWGANGQVVFRAKGRTGVGLRLAPASLDNPLALTDRDEDTAPTLSPDGQQVVFMSRRDGNWEIYLIKADGSNLTRLTDDPATDGLPTWSPDGQTIAFVSNTGGQWAIWAITPDGRNRLKLFEMVGSPDGLVFFDQTNSTGWIEERISWMP